MRPSYITLADALTFIARHYTDSDGSRLAATLGKSPWLALACTSTSSPTPRAACLLTKPSRAHPLPSDWPSGFASCVLVAASDGTPNALAYIYGQAARVCRELGCAYIYTFVEPATRHATLASVGWTALGLNQASVRDLYVKNLRLELST